MKLPSPPTSVKPSLDQAKSLQYASEWGLRIISLSMITRANWETCCQPKRWLWPSFALWEQWREDAVQKESGPLGALPSALWKSLHISESRVPKCSRGLMRWAAFGKHLAQDLLCRGSWTLLFVEPILELHNKDNYPALLFLKKPVLRKHWKMILCCLP